MGNIYFLLGVSYSRKLNIRISLMDSGRTRTSTRINFGQRQTVYIQVLESLNDPARSLTQAIYSILPTDGWINGAYELDTRIVFKIFL